MKKSYLILMVVVLISILSMVGCSKSSTNKDSGSSSSKDGYSNPSTPSAPLKKESSSDEVEIDDMTFIPSVLNVKKGTTVKWTNKETAPHTVSGEGFSSGELAKGESFEHTFNETGPFGYNCGIHSSMTGEIVVE